MAPRDRMADLPAGSPRFVYFGNLFPNEPQFASGLFHGLALVPRFARDIEQDARERLPFADGSIEGFQSQDVFEHIEYAQVGAILDEVFRCLRPGGLFRLSLPDYNSPLLRGRSVYDAEGRILCDPAMGGQVASTTSGPATASFAAGGEAHLWFPTYAGLARLILGSRIRLCGAIRFHHAWFDRFEYVCDPFEAGVMPVARTPPRDMRAGGRPVSLVVDFVK